MSGTPDNINAQYRYREFPSSSDADVLADLSEQRTAAVTYGQGLLHVLGVSPEHPSYALALAGIDDSVMDKMRDFAQQLETPEGNA